MASKWAIALHFCSLVSLIVVVNSTCISFNYNSQRLFRCFNPVATFNLWQDRISNFLRLGIACSKSLQLHNLSWYKDIKRLMSLLFFFFSHKTFIKRLASLWESFKSEEQIQDLISAEVVLQAVQFLASYKKKNKRCWELFPKTSICNTKVSNDYFGWMKAHNIKSQTENPI